MTVSSLTLTRSEILGFRRSTGALDERLDTGADSLRRAAWAGLQDSMPRAALMSLHARVRATGPSTWEDPSLVQVWGPRYSAYVVAARDRAAFTLGRLPEDARGRERAERMAEMLRGHVGDERRRYDDVGTELGVDPNALRYAATTGSVLIRWEGARRPVVWCTDAPHVTAAEARRELARRYLHIEGPGTPDTFEAWAGVSRRSAADTFAALGDELLSVCTPIGDGWLLAADEQAARTPAGPPADARLLPSGDAYFLCWGAQRELLVSRPERRDELWTSRVWPGALLVDGEMRGIWRRAGAIVTARAWGRFTRAQRAAVEAEAASLPVPGLAAGEIAVRWE